MESAGHCLAAINEPSGMETVKSSLSCIQVGLPGGKTLDRFDELVQVCGLPS